MNNDSSQRPPYPGATPPGYPPPGAPYVPPQPYGQQSPMPPQYTQQKPFSTLAIVSMVMGGVSVFMWPLAPITGVVGAITGARGMKQSKQPQGTHRGWGLALAGVITSIAMFLIAVAAIAMFVFLFTRLDEQQRRERNTRFEHRTNSRVTDDLTLIRTRMQTYFIENGNSLAPGGPIVNDGREGLYPVDAPKVEDALTLHDLVRPDEFQRSIDEYTLVILGTSKATVVHVPTKTTLTINDLYDGEWSISETSK